MKSEIVLALCSAALLVAVGCSHFSTKQTDISTTDENGTTTRTITTTASANTFFDGRSSLASFKATQTDKTQGASVGSLSQETSGTNAVNVLKIIVEGATTAK